MYWMIKLDFLGHSRPMSGYVFSRNWQRHVDAQNAIDERKEKGDADKRTTTMLVAPWWRSFLSWGYQGGW